MTKKLKNYAWLILLCGSIQLSYSPWVQAEGLPEHQLKAAFIYNFAIYTHWPNEIGDSFSLCIYGEHSFGSELDKLQEKKVNQHFITVKYTNQINELSDCQMVFISYPSKFNIKDILNPLKGKPVLTITDDINQESTALNFILEDKKIKFDVNLAIAKSSGLSFSSQLLRFAREVHE